MFFFVIIVVLFLRRRDSNIELIGKPIFFYLHDVLDSDLSYNMLIFRRHSICLLGAWIKTTFAGIGI